MAIETTGERTMNSKQRNRLGRIIIATLLTSVLLLIGVKGWLGFGL